MHNRPISEFMTTLARTVSIDTPLREVDGIMQLEKVRHLPVLDQRKLVGVVTLGDLHLVESLDGIDPDVVLVGGAMTPRPYTVRPDEPLRDVAIAMAENRYGCAIVVEQETVVGIFTVTDAVQVLARLLEQGDP